MTDEDSLIEAAARLSREAGPGFETGDYVELVDEEQPDGMVVFRRKDGTPKAYMPRADYEKLRKELANG